MDICAAHARAYFPIAVRITPRWNGRGLRLTYGVYRSLHYFDGFLSRSSEEKAALLRMRRRIRRGGEKGKHRLLCDNVEAIKSCEGKGAGLGECSKRAYCTTSTRTRRQYCTVLYRL